MGQPGNPEWPVLRMRFLAILRETGNARAAARELGEPNLFNNRKKRDPEFRREWDAAVKAADARLKGAEYDFLKRGEGGELQALPRPLPLAGGDLCTDGEALGGYLRPGRKRKPSRPEPVIRRARNGRTQITFAREGHMTSEIEADFLARLRATGNFKRSALAVGFQPASVIARTRKWPAFKRACDEALEEASVMLDYALVAHAHALLGVGSDSEGRPSTMLGTNEVGKGETRHSLPRSSSAAGPSPGRTQEPPNSRARAEEEVAFDPEAAMRIIGFLDRRKTGRTGARPRKGPPERSFEEAVESVLGKIEAIERHEELMKARGEAGQEG